MSKVLGKFRLIDELDSLKDLAAIDQLQEMIEAGNSKQIMGYGMYHAIKHLVRGALFGALAMSATMLLSDNDYGFDPGVLELTAVLDYVQYVIRRRVAMANIHS